MNIFTNTNMNIFYMVFIHVNTMQKIFIFGKYHVENIHICVSTWYLPHKKMYTVVLGIHTHEYFFF